VGSEMCIRDRLRTVLNKVAPWPANPVIARPGVLNKPAY
jgi:hypothetical protein